MFVVYPFGSIVYHAFTRWDGISAAQWVGFHNFRLLWHDPLFRRGPGWRLFRATVFLPAVYATVVIGLLCYTIFQLDGPLNSALGAVGLGSLRHEWLASANTSIPLILLVVIWTNFGYNVLLY